MVRKAEIKVVEGLRGGKGRLEMHHILKPEELNGTWKSVCADQNGAAQQYRIS